MRAERFPRLAGSVPVRILAPGRWRSGPKRLKLISVTRWGVPDNVILSQLPIATVPPQLRVAVPRSVSFAAKRASQSATSPGLVA